MNEPTLDTEPSPEPTANAGMVTEYKRIAFMKHERLPGGLPAAYDASVGGSIVRTTAAGRDDVVVTGANPLNVWHAPWAAVSWAVPGKPDLKVAGKPRRPGVTRVRKPPPPPPVEASSDDEPEDQAEPPAPKAPKPPGEWKPPKPPKKAGQRRVSVPKPEGEAG